MNFKIFFLILGFIFFITCSENGSSNTNSTDIEIMPYYGTYLYQDKQCSGSDIQYTIIDENGISFFDFLGDNCDDTVECYSVQTFDLMEMSSDTLLIMADEESDVTNGIVYIASDSLIIVSYDSNNGTAEYHWEKIKDEIYSFTPICDQEYQNTKDIADILVYAVSDNGYLLWKNYLHGGIWDLGSAITTTQDGGYLIIGELGAIEWGGCCYTHDSDTRDIIKLNNQGIIEWKKEITYSNYGVSDYHLPISISLFKTTQGDLVFLAPVGSRIGVNIIMMNQEGELIWSKEYPEFYGTEITENASGQLVLLGWSGSTKLLKILDNTNGDIISEKEYPGLFYPIAATSAGQDLVVTGFIKRIDSLNYSPTFLLKIDDQGNEIWRKIWDQETEISRGPLDVIETNDGGFLIFCQTDPPPYATLIKTDSEGNEEWRKKYDDYVGGGKGWIHHTDDGGFFMASGYAVTKLDPNGLVEWQAACSSCFPKYFNNGKVTGANYDMRPIEGGAVMVGYGSASWE
ncbi:MAG TPA: hypothetical protein EYO45_01160 [Candidatus Marinimicrobia bacterium]|nr:hypothetical protein [Candidatus Neomarinimicrobiota bacterium]